MSPAEEGARPRPTAIPDAESEPFWAGLVAGRLLVQRCTGEGHHHQLYPRPHCIVCRSPVEWVEASGRGTVYSFTVIRQNFARPFRDMVPYVVALVDLEEGPRLMTNLVGCDPADVSVGAAVRLRIEPVGAAAAVPLFELA
jgi:uncharacterized protein